MTGFSHKSFGHLCLHQAAPDSTFLVRLSSCMDEVIIGREEGFTCKAQTGKGSGKGIGWLAWSCTESPSFTRKSESRVKTWLPDHLTNMPFFWSICWFIVCIHMFQLSSEKARGCLWLWNANRRETAHQAFYIEAQNCHPTELSASRTGLMFRTGENQLNAENATTLF